MANILIVDDRADDLQSAKTILERKNHKITIASNAVEAKEALSRDENFDVILLDVILPDISGPKFLEYIRDKYGESIKCIYVTIIPKNEMKKSSVNGYIQKPYMPAELQNEIERCINK